MNKFIKPLSVINIKEIFYVIFVLLLIKFGFINFFDCINKTLTFKQYILVLISVSLIASSGYLMNSFSNSKNPKLKGDPITFIYFILCTIIGISSGIYISIIKETPLSIFIFLFSWVIILIISRYITKRSFLKDLSISFFASSALLTLWWFYKPKTLTVLEWQLFFKLSMAIILFAILVFNAILVKLIFVSLQYHRKDQKKNNLTLAVVFGTKTTKDILFGISIICNFFTLFISYFYIKNINIFFVLLGIILLHMPIMHKSVRESRTEKDFNYIFRILEISYFITTPIFVISTAIIIKNANL